MTGFVYAIQADDAIKIGWAADPVRRLSELNVGSPGTHRLIGFVAATKSQERELHLLLSREISFASPRCREVADADAGGC